ncbi:hypothetical protein RJ639_017405 [Escallonia herrerae]|uniref:F-box associated beta-propeller type 3 domain-containing protein n=1 Tax=Escallonia herrerae TaxID=1293975 RepID=A0AA89AK77_9ASTE|nr:hypothetical protein RJ639_017405 [Escallonia herrerae]
MMIKSSCGTLQPSSTSASWIPYIIHASASTKRRVAVGFGHDPVRNDYNLVSVVKNPQLTGNSRGWYVCLLSFDLCGEAIGRVPLPDIGNILGSDVVLGNYKEPLALVNHCRYENCFDLWVMDDCDGGKDAWSKNYTFIPIVPVQVGDLIGCLKNGEIVFRDKKDTLFLFDIESPETWILSLDGVVTAIFDCTESLLHIKGAKQLETDAAGKGNGMRQMKASNYGLMSVHKGDSPRRWTSICYRFENNASFAVCEYTDNVMIHAKSEKVMLNNNRNHQYIMNFESCETSIIEQPEHCSHTFKVEACPGQKNHLLFSNIWLNIDIMDLHGITEEFQSSTRCKKDIG